MMNAEAVDLAKYLRRLRHMDPVKTVGAVRRAVGVVIESQGPPVSVGELCEIVGSDRAGSIPAEVIGFRDNYVLSMPLFKVHG